MLPGSASATAPSPFTEGDRPAANPRFGDPGQRAHQQPAPDPGRLGSAAADQPRRRQRGHHYGYNTLDGAPLTQDPNEAHKTEPDKNVYLVLRRQALPLPGPRDRPARLRHAHQPRRGRPSQAGHAHRRHRDSAAPPNPTFDGITWDPFTHQLLLTAESSLADRRRLRRRPRRAGDPSTAARPPASPATRLGRLRGHPERRRRQRLDRRGHRRRPRPATAGGKVPNSYVYRFVADRPKVT